MEVERTLGQLCAVHAKLEHESKLLSCISQLRMDAWQDRRSKHSKAHRRSGCRHSRRLELEQVDAGEGGRSRYLTEAQPASGQDRVTRQSDDTQPAARRDRRSRPEDPMQSDSECDIVRPALDEARRSRRRVTDEGAHRVER